MKKLLLIASLLWVAWCFAAPSVVIGAGSMRYSNNAHILVNGGAVINTNTGTPFFAVNTKACATATTFFGPEGSLDALIVTPTGDMGNTTVSIYSGSYHPNTTTSVIQWWNINPATDQPCNLEFRFRNAYLNGLTLADLAVWQYNGSWVKLSENITGSNVGSAFTSVTFGGVNFAASKAAHQIIIADKQDSTLPVELSYFNATSSSDGIVNLMWTTQSESGMLGYYVWRSHDGYLANSSVVSSLIQATNTSTTQTYGFSDESVETSGTWYYWLQALSMDGTERYYGSISVITVQPEPEPPTPPLFSGITNLYPNPFNPSLAISYGLKSDATCSISILNVKGQVIRTLQNSSVRAGNYTLHWDGNDQNGISCSSGIYFIRMQAGKESFLKRAVLMK